MTYFLTRKEDGREWQVPAVWEECYFSLIEQLTGLDPPIAGMILRSGQAIIHPAYVFRSSAGGRA